VSGDSSAHAQIHTFADYGLILSSHSSQLVNVMFTHANAAMMEISAEFYNADFSEYAHGMGVFFQYAFGGEIPGGRPDANMEECIRLLNTCEGDSHCILIKRFQCPKPRSAANKPLNFNANLTSVEIALSHVLSHLNWACMGKW
jgi:hypothetical protein